MRNLAIFLITLILIASLSGCAKTVRSAKPETYHVALYYTADIHRPYKVIGIAITSAEPFHHVLAATEQLQHEARQMGGDAMIDLSQGAPQGLEMPPGEWFIFGLPKRY
jgi:hypothetical protein